MTIGRDECIQALAAISAHRTAPFYEARMGAYILGELRRIGLPVSRDRYGNIIALYEGAGAPAGGGIALMAHMDHPGFEVVNDADTEGVLIGGVRADYFDRPVAVRVFPALPEDGSPDDGITGRVTGYRASENEPVRLDLQLDGRPPGLPAFGVWDLPGLEVRDGLAYMRAADDSAGCAVILMVLEALVSLNAPCRCYGIFTRAEEVGFIGAASLARDRTLPSDTVVVSLETSKALPGAEIGDGPVIRVGDRLNTFDNGAEAILRAARDRLASENPKMKVGRQLMSGGACEASVFVLEGYPTTAMALPLGNYHNMGPDVTIEPEYISLDDMATQVELLVRAAEIGPAEAPAGDRKKLHARADSKREKLVSSYATWPREAEHD